jgi:hypothetical protein
VGSTTSPDCSDGRSDVVAGIDSDGLGSDTRRSVALPVPVGAGSKAGTGSAVLPVPVGVGYKAGAGSDILLVPVGAGSKTVVGSVVLPVLVSVGSKTVVGSIVLLVLVSVGSKTVVVSIVLLVFVGAGSKVVVGSVVLPVLAGAGTKVGVASTSGTDATTVSGTVLELPSDAMDGSALTGCKGPDPESMVPAISFPVVPLSTGRGSRADSESSMELRSNNRAARNMVSKRPRRACKFPFGFNYWL